MPKPSICVNIRALVRSALCGASAPRHSTESALRTCTRERRVVCTALIALGALLDRLVPPTARANTPPDATALCQLLLAARQRLELAAASTRASSPFPQLPLLQPQHTCGPPFVRADGAFGGELHYSFANSSPALVKPHAGGYGTAEAGPFSEHTRADDGTASGPEDDDEADEKALSELSGSDSASSAKRRRARTNFTSGQMLELEKAFITCHYPDLVAREAIAAHLRLPESRVQVRVICLKLFKLLSTTFELDPIEFI